MGSLGIVAHLLGSILLLGAGSSGSEEGISLAGPWRCRLDKGDVGQAEKWFERDLPGTIVLPGSLTENGYGDEIKIDTPWTGSIIDKGYFTDPRYEKYRQPGNIKVPFWLTPLKYYVGPAWYQKDIEVPEGWKGKRVVLSLERCHWETRLWLGGRSVGTQNSLTTPHEYDLGVVPPGRHRLTLRVDNRVMIDVGKDAHSVSDHTQTNWNGIIGRIELRSTEAVWVQDVQVFPDVAGKKVRVQVEVCNETGTDVKAALSLAARSTNGPRAHAVAVRSQAARLSAKVNKIVLDYPLGSDALLWDEFSPAFYELDVAFRATAAGKELMSRKGVTFGLREFKAKGTRFTLNGRPVFLRGTLECTIFPLTGYPPANVEEWRKVYRICRAHGLNHMRFHSNCPPEAAFVAADLEGFLLQVEGPHWTTIGNGGAIDAYVYAETDRILRCYGNHPSFVMMNYGNEPGGANQKRFFGELIKHWKSFDTRHAYTSAAGWPMISENDYHSTPAPRIHAWGAALASRINARPPETMTDYRDQVGRSTVPIVSHEIGQWCVYPNFKEIAKYTGVTRAYNFEVFRDSLTGNHMGDQAEAFLMASGKLQALCYKEEIESALRTPGFGGFQLLDLHDFPGQGTALVGVLDAFWGEKGYITPQEYRRFSGPTVPLARMAKRIWANGETFTAKVELAHFGPKPLRDARTRWTLRDGSGGVIASGQWVSRQLPIDNTIPLGEVSAPLGKVGKAQKLVLTVAIEGADAANDWDIWVYPSRVETLPGDVLIVSELDAKAEEVLKAGGKVMLMPADKTVKPDRYGRVPPGFSSIFWNTAWTGRQPPHTLGILCDPRHPALSDFPTEYHSNWQWWELLSRSQAMILDALPARFRPVVQVVDDWFTCRRLGLVFEARVGGGRLLVCAIDLRKDLESRLVARQMLHSLLGYMNGEGFSPKETLELSLIRDLMVPAPMLTRLGAKVIKADSEASGHEAFRAIDGDPSTIWHTAWEPEAPDFPHEIQIDMQRTVRLKGFRYLPRQDMVNGRITDYAVYLSNDTRQWGEPVARSTFARYGDEKFIQFERLVEGRYLRLVALAGQKGQKFASVAELDVVSGE